MKETQGSRPTRLPSGASDPETHPAAKAKSGKVRMRAPQGTTSISFGTVNYAIPLSGIVEVDPDDAGELAKNGFSVIE